MEMEGNIIIQNRKLINNIIFYIELQKPDHFYHHQFLRSPRQISQMKYSYLPVNGF